MSGWGNSELEVTTREGERVELRVQDETMLGCEGGAGVRRWLTLVTGLLECLCFAGAMFGWASLVLVLKTEGYFSYLCVNITGVNGMQFLDCSGQDEQFSLIFTIASFMNNFLLLPNGFLFDRFGTMVARLLGISLYTTGALFVAFSNSALSSLLFPALSFIAVGGILFVVTNMQIGNLFGSNRSTIITLYNGAFDSSSALFLIIKLLFEVGISLRASFLFLAACGVIHLVRTFLLLPRTHIPYPLPEGYTYGAIPTGKNTSPTPSLRATPTGKITSPNPSLRATPTGKNTSSTPSLGATPTGKNTSPTPSLRATPTGKNTSPTPSLRATPTGKNTSPNPSLRATPTGKNTSPPPSLRATPTAQELDRKYTQGKKGIHVCSVFVALRRRMKSCGQTKTFSPEQAAANGNVQSDDVMEEMPFNKESAEKVATFWECFLSKFFIWHLVWLSVMQLRHYLFIGTLNPMLQRLTQGEPSLVSTYTNAFAVTQLCGVLFAPWNGLIMDRHKGKPRTPVVSLLQYPCFILVKGVLGGDPLYVNIALTLVSLLAFIHPVCVYLHCRGLAAQRGIPKDSPSS
ncbi:unnamed protein product [Coregonus sp. 'balchen']|nr:unnamed protein product [Coregonus sp. 'balchen']